MLTVRECDNLFKSSGRFAPTGGVNYRQAIKLAEYQAERLLRCAGVAGPPVPVMHLAEVLDVMVRYDPALRGRRAQSELIMGQRRISHTETTRIGRNLAVAHHLKRLLDQPFESWLYPHADLMSPTLRQHYFAEYFAASLLMPRRWVKRAWRDGCRDVEELAKRFGIPPETMAFRLQMLGLVPAEPHRAADNDAIGPA